MSTDQPKKKHKGKKDQIIEAHDVLSVPGAAGEFNHPDVKVPGVDGELQYMHLVTTKIDVVMERREDGTFATSYKNLETGKGFDL